MVTEAVAIERFPSGKKQEDNILSMLVDQDELTWQNIIMELIKSEQMDPWNIDVSIIAEKFSKLLSAMKKMDFRISGKIILAAAFFLKIKSDKLLNEDIAMLDNLIKPIDNPNELMDLLEGMPEELRIPHEKPVLAFRTPQPRKRKVSVYDLMNALEKALQTEQKRVSRMKPTPKMRVPTKSKDMTLVINDLYKQIRKTLQKVKVVWFHELAPGTSKEDIVITFVPLLHLETQRKIDITQKKPFGDISITLTNIKKDYA